MSRKKKENSFSQFITKIYFFKCITFKIDNGHRVPEVSLLELAKFPNETYLGSVKKQAAALRVLGLEHAPKVVIYNRVPKCGSTTTLDIIRYLKRKLKFNVFNDIAPKMKVKFFQFYQMLNFKFSTLWKTRSKSWN